MGSPNWTEADSVKAKKLWVQYSNNLISRTGPAKLSGLIRKADRCGLVNRFETLSRKEMLKV